MSLIKFMKRSVFTTFLFILLINEATNSQSIYFGFHNEFSSIYTNNNNGKEVVFNPGSLYGILGINVLNEFSFETRLGYLFNISNNYGGPEIGFYLRSPSFYKRLYLLGGINFHINIPNNPDIISKTISLAGLGIGVSIYKSFLIEIIYFYPIQKDYISYGPFRGNPALSDILKLGIGFNFVN